MTASVSCNNVKRFYLGKMRQIQTENWYGAVLRSPTGYRKSFYDNQKFAGLSPWLPENVEICTLTKKNTFAIFYIRHKDACEHMTKLLGNFRNTYCCLFRSNPRSKAHGGNYINVRLLLAAIFCVIVYCLNLDFYNVPVVLSSYLQLHTFQLTATPYLTTHYSSPIFFQKYIRFWNFQIRRKLKSGSFYG